MVVDDSNIARSIVKDLLEEIGMRVDCAASGAEAIALIADAALFIAEGAVLVLDAAASLFFAALPFDIRGDILANILVHIDNIDISGAVSASLNGVGLAGSVDFLPIPKVCIQIPGIASLPGASDLGINSDPNFCFPPF